MEDIQFKWNGRSYVLKWNGIWRWFDKDKGGQGEPLWGYTPHPAFKKKIENALARYKQQHPEIYRR